MEVFVVLALVAAATSSASVNPTNWSKVVPVHDLPQFYHKYQELENEPKKIVGGMEALVGQFPYMVYCATHTPENSFYCGGSILSKEFVLTAAHCVDRQGAYDFTLIFGAHDVTANEPSQIIVKAVDWVIHADWNPLILANDIALFRVAPIQFNDRIQPIRLPSRSQQSNSFAGESATVSGWGLTSDDNTILTSPVLRFVRQPIVTNLMCYFAFPPFILDSHICMSGEYGGGACNGDSGGPLTVNENDGLPTQVGITSYGLEGLCEIGHPVVFTRVTFFLDWIQANTDVTIRP